MVAPADRNKVFLGGFDSSDDFWSGGPGIAPVPPHPWVEEHGGNHRSGWPPRPGRPKSPILFPLTKFTNPFSAQKTPGCSPPPKFRGLRALGTSNPSTAKKTGHHRYKRPFRRRHKNQGPLRINQNLLSTFQFVTGILTHLLERTKQGAYLGKWLILKIRLTQFEGRLGSPCTIQLE